MTESTYLSIVASRISQTFQDANTILSFGQYLKLFEERPLLLARSSAQYMYDAIMHFGHRTVDSAYGTRTRFGIFDAPFGRGEDPLVGQERVQEDFVRQLSNMATEGRGNRLLLLHGPNGSAKTSFVNALFRGLAEYSRLGDGALYSFNWIFPKEAFQGRHVGFSDARTAGRAVDSFSLLDEADIAVRFPSELRDHPVFLIPVEHRCELLDRLEAQNPGLKFTRWVRTGELGPVSRRIFDTLLASYGGDLGRVLAHVQVERFHFSQRYRRGLVTVEPQMHVDAQARMVSLDENYASLPAVLRHITLYHIAGDLVDAHRGAIEFSDMLKRPLDAYKYLLSACESGQVSVDGVILFFDTVFIGTTNDKYLYAFSKSPDFASFKGRMELVKVPYLMDYRLEQKVYEVFVKPPSVTCHVAPHTTRVAAQWAVGTRMRKPKLEGVSSSLAATVSRLSPLEKAELYSSGETPHGLSHERAKELREGLPMLMDEYEDRPDYEGALGASAREMRTVLLNAAQKAKNGCLSPGAVIREIRELCADRLLYEFLQVEPEDGFGDAERIADLVYEGYLALIETEFQAALGHVSSADFEKLIHKYILHASAYLKSEKLTDPITREPTAPDEAFMKDLEGRWEHAGEPTAVRQAMLGRVAAFGLDNPGQVVPYGRLFSKELSELSESYYAENQAETARLLKLVLDYRDGRLPESASDRLAAEQVVQRLLTSFGYCETCLGEMLLALAGKLLK